MSEKFWKERFSKYPDLRGAGHFGKTIEQNQSEYSEGIQSILELICETTKDIDSILDVGCGIGWHAKFFESDNYTCLDITDVLFAELKKESDCKFIKCDITKELIQKKYDLILMIDVTQHLVTDFSFAMQNIKNAMNGKLIITSFLSKYCLRINEYEIHRPLSHYKREFENYKFSEPLKYRDKYVFSIER